MKLEEELGLLKYAEKKINLHDVAIDPEPVIMYVNDKNDNSFDNKMDQTFSNFTLIKDEKFGIRKNNYEKLPAVLDPCMLGYDSITRNMIVEKHAVNHLQFSSNLEIEEKNQKKDQIITKNEN
jgi:hypothetical protein